MYLDELSFCLWQLRIQILPLFHFLPLCGVEAHVQSVSGMESFNECLISNIFSISILFISFEKKCLALYVLKGASQTWPFFPKLPKDLKSCFPKT